MLTYDFAIDISEAVMYTAVMYTATKSMTTYGVIAYMYPLQYSLDKP